jgi:hypothetical protein
MSDWHNEGIRGKMPFYAQLYPCIALVTRGKLLDWWIHKHYKTYNVVTKMYYPENPRTAFQQAWRNVFYWANKNWQGFSVDVKNYYREKTTPKAYTGQLRYLKMYLNANYPPSYPSGYALLLETGGRTLLESGDFLLLDIDYYKILQEIGDPLLLETGYYMLK